MQPNFAVVIPAYNEEEHVASAIRSVLAQTRGDFELVVVDDGSADETAAVVESFEAEPRVRLIRQPNMGLSGARNTGIEATKAQYISFLDSDDLFMPDYLEKVGEVFESDSGVGFVYSDAWWLQEPTGRFYRASSMARQNPPATPPRDPDDFLRLLIRRNFIFSWATVRREALAVTGDFKTSLTACEDYDLWIRLLAHGFGAIQAKGRLAIQRDRSDSMSWNKRNMRSNLQKVYGATVTEYDVPDDVREVARAQIVEIEDEIEALDGNSPATAAWWAVRARLGALRKQALRKRIWHSETPPEVATAFPELFVRGA